MGILAESIKRKLEVRFSPSQLEVQDQSHLHAGHGGAAEHKAAFPALMPVTTDGREHCNG